MQKIDILAFAAHPDDTELSCCGTLMKHISLGYKVGVVDLTMGELGTRGSAEIRLMEAKSAAEFIGLTVRENLGMKDGFFQKTPENLDSVIRVIRKFKPEIVLANALEDRHPDHARAANLVSEACFLSGLIKIETSQEAWRPKALYHYIQDYNLAPDFVLDISGFMQKKLEAIACFKSQFYDPNSKEPESPISSKGFMDFIESKARVLGRHIGGEYGEGFNVSRNIGVSNLFDLL
jgi:bacillithiol biosynthesis deacetylase BshB1